MSTLVIPNVAVSATTISSIEYNANLTAISTWANGNIDDANLLNSGITGSTKLVNLSVTKGKLAADCIDSTKIEDDALLSEHVGYDGVVVVPLDYAATGRVEGAVFHNITGDSLVLKSAQLICSTPPTGSAEEISVVNQGASYTDPDTGGTAVTFTTSNPDIAASDHVGTERTVNTGGTVVDGGALVFNVIGSNGATNVSIALKLGRE